MSKLNFSKTDAVLSIIIIILLGVIGWLAYVDSSGSNVSTLSNSQIFNQTAQQLNLKRSSLKYFRIFGQHKVQYNTGKGSTYAYKLDGRWHALAAEQGVQSCRIFDAVPVSYRPECVDSAGKLKYAIQFPDGTSSSLNYPIEEAVSYIGQ